MPKRDKDFTKGSIIRSIFALAIPIVLVNILQSAYQLIDTFWVGRLGAGAVAAVSISFPILFLAISLGAGLAIAGSILIAQYWGRKEKKKVSYITSQTFVFVFFTSVLLSLIGYLTSGPLIRLVGAGPDIYPDAVAYLQISFIGMIFVFTYFVFQSVMRGVGEVKIPTYIIIGSVILNFFLDPILMLGYGPIPALGVKGVAWATVITEGLSAIIGLIILIKGKSAVHIKAKDLKPDFKLAKKLIRLGFPASIEQSIRSISFILMTMLVVGFGTVVVASYGLGMRILSFIIIPALGFAIATSTLVGHNIGAGKIKRAQQVTNRGVAIAFTSLTALGLVFFIFAPQIVAAFVPGDAAVIAESARFIRIIAFTFGFIAVQMVLIGTLRGAGDTVAAMVFSLISFISLFAFGFILSRYTPLGHEGLWWAFPISNVLSTIIAYVWYKKGSWKKRRITEETDLQSKIIEETEAEEGISS